MTRLAQGGQGGASLRVTQGAARRLPSPLVEQTPRGPTQGRSLAGLRRGGGVRSRPPGAAGLFLNRRRCEGGDSDEDTAPGGRALAPLPQAAHTLTQERPVPSGPSWLNNPLLLQSLKSRSLAAGRPRAQDMKRREETGRERRPPAASRREELFYRRGSRSAGAKMSLPFRMLGSLSSCPFAISPQVYLFYS